MWDFVFFTEKSEERGREQSYGKNVDGSVRGETDDAKRRTPGFDPGIDPAAADSQC